MEKKKTGVIKTLILAVGVCISLSECTDFMGNTQASSSASGTSTSSATNQLSAEEQAQILADAQTTADNFEQAWDGTSSSGSKTPAQVKSADSTNDAVLSFMKSKIQVTKQHSGRYLSKSTSPDSISSMKTQLLANLNASVDSAFTTSSDYKEIVKAFYKSYVDIFSSYYSTDSLQSTGYKTAVDNLIKSTNNIVLNSTSLGKTEVIDLLKTTATLSSLDTKMVARMTSSSKQNASPMQKSFWDVFNPSTWISALGKVISGIFSGDPLSGMLQLYTMSCKGLAISTGLEVADMVNLGGSSVISKSIYTKTFTTTSNAGTGVKTYLLYGKITDGDVRSLASTAAKTYLHSPGWDSRDQVTTTFDCSCMGPGARLDPGQCIYSANRSYMLKMQDDGNLVIYKIFYYLPSIAIVNGKTTFVCLYAYMSAVWSPRTDIQLSANRSKGPFYAYVNANNRLMVCNSNNASVWISPNYTTTASGNPNGFITLTNNGYLYVVKNSNTYDAISYR